MGSSAERLAAAAHTLHGSVRTQRLAGFAEMLAAVQRERPLVVVNLLGSCAETAIPLAKACMPDGNYVDPLTRRRRAPIRWRPAVDVRFG